jgi:hypothetical protein
MSDISERLVVHCPDNEASRHLATFIAEHRVRDGSVRIALRLPISMFADRRTLTERRAIATLYPLRSSSDPHPTYSVTWASKGGAPYPDFAGALAVEKSARDDCFGLVVSGHYEPPAGTVGGVFDAALGRRIAQASARDLLRSIADYVENACAHSAAARAGYARYAGSLSGDSTVHQKHFERRLRTRSDLHRLSSVE